MSWKRSVGPTALTWGGAATAGSTAAEANETNRAAAAARSRSFICKFSLAEDGIVVDAYVRRDAADREAGPGRDGQDVRRRRRDGAADRLQREDDDGGGL